MVGPTRSGRLAFASLGLYIVYTKQTSSPGLYMHKRTKTAQVNLRLLPELKAAAERAATDDHRSLTSLIEKLLADYLRERGYLNTAA
jgi:hypothetical protein